MPPHWQLRAIPSPSTLLMHRGLVSMVTPSFSEIPICLCLIILTWASNVADLFLELFPCYSLSLLPSQVSPSLTFRNTLNFSVPGSSQASIPGDGSQ